MTVMGGQDARINDAVHKPAAPLLERLHAWTSTVDHKKLGVMYIFSGLVFFLIGGVEATMIRAQLLVPANDLLQPGTFNQMFTMHGTTMVFLVGMPVLLGFGNYLIPLMIGTRDMAFPRLNAYGFWLFLFGAILLYFSFVGSSGLYGAPRGPAGASVLGVSTSGQILRSVRMNLFLFRGCY